jgi:serpin B
MAGDTSPGPQLYEKAEFHATRPFLYFILEESTRSIFFIGTYCGN